MYQFLISILFIVPVFVKAQEPVTFNEVDSITWQCFVKGDWEKLIKTGKQAIAQNIDYKRLRQRMGYAYFVKADYFASQKQYEKALEFDASDSDTHEYLYYCGINTGNEALARVHAKNLPKEVQQNLRIKTFELIDAVDFEYNYKSNNGKARSHPNYVRLGINTQLGYRWSLYQSISTYKQTVDAAHVNQPAYFALLSCTISPHSFLKVGYHYMNTRVDTLKFPRDLILASFSTRINRFYMGLNGSVLSDSIGQAGIQGALTLPGKFNIYMRSSVIRMIEKRKNRTIFSQAIGGRIYKNLWAEGNVTLGNLKYYQDNNGLYIYNSIDPTTFRAGGTLFWTFRNGITLVGNYTFDKKHIDYTNTNYNQHSFSGGIIWKL